MKAVLLRVGIDTNYGALSPVWDDMSYVYFPIWNKNIKEIEKGEKRTYSDLMKNDVKYLPGKLHDRIVHYDPEFETFTYGDPMTNKKNLLRSLDKGDLLIFYMGGVMQNASKEKGCFIFGYFDVTEIYKMDGVLTKSQRKFIKEKYPNNAHAISSKTQTDLTIIQGSNKSKKLEKCIKITVLNEKSDNPLYITKPELTKSCGIRRFITRAVPIKITDKYHLENLKRLIGI